LAAAADGANRAWATERWVARRLVEPVLLVDDWPLPTQPLPVGRGAVHADLTDDDQELFAGLRHTLGRDASERDPIAADPPLEPETLAAAAQELRLPVTPYRDLAQARRSGVGANSDTGSTSWDRAPRGWARPDPLVVDLSALWAGPLATSLLAELGARVVKINPGCRPDGLGQHPPLYRALNGTKTIVDLDLRRRADRDQFESLLGQADLLVDSFSRRVMPNLGYGPDDLGTRFPTLSTLSIVAFPAGSAEQDWVAYGPGVHAASGLALDRGQARPRPAPIAYPDALAGLAAFAAGSRALAAEPDAPRHHHEVSLAGSLQPLVAAALEAA
jgi:hypothetical protein